MPGDKTFKELCHLREEVRRLRKSLTILKPGLAGILRRRGFQIYKKEPSNDLFIPSPEHIDDFYSMLHKYSFRLFLREIIKHQTFFTLADVTRYATGRVTSEYLTYMAQIGLVSIHRGGYRTVRRIKSFGETLEWYVAELLKREFCAEALRGVKFKRANIGGDYDILAKLDGLLWYVEVKSSPPRQVYDREISSFLDRVLDLSPEIAVFFMDTELRMKDKIVPMFEAAFACRKPVSPGVIRIEKELFQIENRIFIINAKDSILRNFEVVLKRYFRR